MRILHAALSKRHKPAAADTEATVSISIPELVRGEEFRFRRELLARIRRSLGDAYQRGEITIVQSIEASRALGSIDQVVSNA